MYNFSILADQHLGASLEEQLDACCRLLINNIELDAGLGGLNLVQLAGSKLESIRNLLIATNKKIVLLDCDLSNHTVEQINLLFRKAHLLGVENVKITQWETAGSEDLAALERLFAGALPIAYSYSIGVVIENKRATCLSAEPELAAFVMKCNEHQPGLLFNPLEFAAEKKHPFFHVFYNSRLKPLIRFLRINDGLFIDGSPTLPAEGNAEIKELASALLARSYKGYFSFHPYLSNMDIKTYGEVIERFKRLLMAM